MKNAALAILFLLASAFALPRHAIAADRVTILYDAFGDKKDLTKDWGFSALVEHDGKRILFDTGNNAALFEKNVKALGIDLTTIDFAVISHRHADHATGLKYLLRVNPNITIYVPADGANGFGNGLFPPGFLRPEAELPSSMRYFDGAPPADLKSGSPYDAGHFVLVNKLTEVAPGIFVVPTVSQKKGTLELPELTLAIKRSGGLLLVDGCSHAGIEAILEAASSIDKRFDIIFGGLHLVTTPADEIDALVENLKTKWQVKRIAPGHCTGEPAFLRLKKAYGDNYLYAGLGANIELN